MALYGSFLLFTRIGGPSWIGLGWLAHSLWDGLLHGSNQHAYVPAWYVPGCLGYDLVVGLSILRTLRRRQALVVEPRLGWRRRQRR